MDDRKWTRRGALRSVAAAGVVASMPLMAQDKEPPEPRKEPPEPRKKRVRLKEGPEILVGQSVQMTGPMAVTIQPVLKGQSMAIEELNRNGGINGRPVRLLQMDDMYDAKKCVENVNVLIDKEKVCALFGMGTTPSVIATLPILAEKKVPLICTYSGSPVLRTKHHPYFFTTLASYRDEVVQMVRNLVTLQKTQIGLIYQNAPFGQLMMPVVEEVVKELGATLVGKQPIEPSGSDAQTAVQNLAASRPQAVLYMAFGASLIGVVKGVRAYIGVPVYAISLANSKAVLAALGDEARGLAFTQIIPYPWRQTTGLTRDFGAAMERAGIPVDYDHFFGYVNMRVLLEGLRRAGSQVNSETIVRGMESMTKVDLGGYPLAYGPQKHHGSNFVEITIVGPGGRFMR